ncbi:MAG: heme-binding protein [Granulosicoccus sp.]
MIKTIRGHRAVLISCITSIGLAGCTVFGVSNVEEAAHTVLISENEFELREYAPVVVARTVVDAEFKEAGNTAFRRLFGYISGDNSRAQKIAMTAPVISDNQADGKKIEMTAPVIGEKSVTGWTYSFVLPSTYSIDTAPQPEDNRVELAKLPEKSVAVIRYSGLQKESLMQNKLNELKQWMDGKSFVAVSAPRWAGYNPPFTLPWFRRNEVMIDVEQRAEQ